jgi:hypothetical protein
MLLCVKKGDVKIFDAPFLLLIILLLILFSYKCFILNEIVIQVHKKQLCTPLCQL